MKYKLIKTIFMGLILNVGSASADIINFNVTESDFAVEQFESKDFIITSTSDGLGLVGPERDDSFFTGKGSRLLSWSNSGSQSGFTLETDNSDIFSLESFQSGNGYVSGLNPVTSLTLNGLLFDGTTISEDFSSTGKINLSSLWSDLVFVEFIAHGLDNRAYWDSIRFERFEAPASVSVSVSEPSTLLIFALSLIFLSIGLFKSNYRH